MKRILGSQTARVPMPRRDRLPVRHGGSRAGPRHFTLTSRGRSECEDRERGRPMTIGAWSGSPRWILFTICNSSYTKKLCMLDGERVVYLSAFILGLLQRSLEMSMSWRTMTKKELKAHFKKLDRIHEEDPRQPDSPCSYASARPIARETWRDQDRSIARVRVVCLDRELGTYSCEVTWREQGRPSTFHPNLSGEEWMRRSREGPPNDDRRVEWKPKIVD